MNPSPGTSGAILNAMSVDVEEHFQVSAFEGVVPRDAWGSLPSRVQANTDRLLDLLEGLGVRATFFILGWLAKRHPMLVRRIAERGHEIASHGYSHRLVYEQEPGQFREEVLASRALLQDATGTAVTGYRAASFSIRRRNLWALDVLVEAGYSYDSSLFPVVHDRYGIPGAPRWIYRAEMPSGASIIEVPPSTIAVGGSVLPFGSGGYLRIYPLFVTRWAIDRLIRRDRRPAVLYVHPWELDPDQPRMRGPLVSRLRHYWGLSTTRRKLGYLLSRYPFGTVSEVIAQAGDLPKVALAHGPRPPVSVLT